jgi:hypothetical protein
MIIHYAMLNLEDRNGALWLIIVENFMFEIPRQLTADEK